WASPAPLQTAASAKAADAHLGDPRATIRGAESNASVEVTACQAQAKGRASRQRQDLPVAPAGPTRPHPDGDHGDSLYHQEDVDRHVN
ncbi:MAG: hypothetical protein ABWY93_13640, partial [Mycobacterium sp.]